MDKKKDKKPKGFDPTRKPASSDNEIDTQWEAEGKKKYDIEKYLKPRNPNATQKRNPMLEGGYDHKKAYAKAMAEKSKASKEKWLQRLEEMDNKPKKMEPPKSSSGIGESSKNLQTKSHEEIIKGAKEQLNAPKVSIGEAILNKLRSQGVSEEEIQKRLKNLK